MHIHCNAGVLIVTLIGDLPGYGPVWYHPDAIANILSQSRVEDHDDTLITYNSRSGDGIIVHDKDDQPMHHYQRCQKGLFYRDMSEQAGTTLMGVATVKRNESKFTNRDVLRAKQARKFQDLMGLSLQGLLNEIDCGTVRNNPITRRAARMAESIYGPSVSNLMGKTTYKKAAPAISEIEQVPRSILEHYEQVFLEADVFFINGLRFLHTISTDIRYRTSQYIADASMPTLLTCLIAVCTLYRARGFLVTQVTTDGEFKPLKTDALKAGIPLNITGADEHAKSAERSIRTTKERVRGTYNTLPFQKIPPLILIGLVISATSCLNMVVAYNGVSSHMSPRYIMTGKHTCFKKHCQVTLGEYAHVHESHDNSMGTRTVGAIALHSTLNDEGSVSYFSLQTGRTITRTRATPLPMPAHAIERVERMSRRKLPGLTFGDRYNNPDPLPDDEESLSENDDDSDSDYDPNMDADGSGSADSSHNHNDDNDNNTNDSSEDSTDSDYDPDDDNDDDTIVFAPDSSESSLAPSSTNTEIIGAPLGLAGAPDELLNAETDVARPPVAPAASRRAGLRIPKEINYNSLSDTATHLKTIGYNNLVSGVTWNEGNESLKHYVHAMNAICQYNEWSEIEIIESTALTQYTLKKGLEVFGTKGATAVTKELQQLHNRGVLEAKKFYELTAEQRVRSLAYLMFLKQKRDDSIKGR